LITVDKASFGRSLFASSNSKETDQKRNTTVIISVAGSFHINGCAFSGGAQAPSAAMRG
jgi:hypothetical protein